MSVSSVKYLSQESELSKLNLEPWWEKARSYAFAGSFITSLMPFYLTLGGFHVNCVPTNSLPNANPICDCEGEASSNFHIGYINSRCSTDSSLTEMRILARGLLSMSSLTLLVTTFWLSYNVSAVASFRHFAAARQKFLGLVINGGEIKALCSKILVQDDERNGANLKTMREICSLLTVYGNKSSLYPLYKSRFAFLAFTLSVEMVISVVAYSALQDIVDTFECRLQEFKTTTLENKTIQDTFICASNESTSILSFLRYFMVLLLPQFVFVGWGLAVVHRHIERGSKKLSKSLKLLMIFAENAMRSDTFRDLVNYLYSSEFERSVCRQIDDIIENKDYQLLAIKAKISRTTPEVISCLSKSFDTDKSLEEFPLSKYIEVLTAARYQLTHKATLELIKKLVTAKKWEILVHLLENSRSKKKKYKSEATGYLNSIKLDIPLDVVDSSSAGKGRSILYYAFNERNSYGQIEFVAAKILCEGRRLRELKVVLPSNESESDTQADSEEARTDSDSERDPIVHAQEDTEQTVDLKSFLLGIYSEKEARRIIGILKLQKDYQPNNPV